MRFGCEAWRLAWDDAPAGDEKRENGMLLICTGIADEIIAASSITRQSKTILARLFYGSLKSPTCSCVWITLPDSS
jgi:hypothetical protein